LDTKNGKFSITGDKMVACDDVRGMERNPKSFRFYLEWRF
jgi:hypothetical protein